MRIAELYRTEADLHGLATQVRLAGGRSDTGSDDRHADVAHPPPRLRLAQVAARRGAYLHGKYRTVSRLPD